MPGVENKVVKAHLLADPTQAALSVAQEKSQIVVNIPAQATDPINTVMVLMIEGRPVVAALPAK